MIKPKVLDSSFTKNYGQSILAILVILFGYLGYINVGGAAKIYFLSSVILGILVLFNVPSNWIEDSLASISHRFKISSAIAGGFFLAIASSAPEFFTSFSGVVWHKIFDIGFDTLIWSSIFNLCVIIGVGTFFKSEELFVRKRILKRDMPILGVTIIVLLLLAIDGAYSSSDFGILIMLYIVYIFFLISDKSRPYKNPNNDISWKAIILKLIIGLIAIAILAHSMISVGQEVIKLIGHHYKYVVPLGVLACTIYGPGTSFTDLFMSVSAIKKGEDTAAIINGISSNTFDLTICLGIPGLVYTLMSGKDILIDLNSSLLLISMLLLSYFLVFLVLRNGRVSRKEGISLLIFYALSTIIYLIYILKY